jgi:hypothetical protein
MKPGDGKHGRPVDIDRIMVRARLQSHLEGLKQRFPMTGYGQDGDRRLSQEAGFSAHLFKPLGFDALRMALGHCESVVRERPRAWKRLDNLHRK